MKAVTFRIIVQRKLLIKRLSSTSYQKFIISNSKQFAMKPELCEKTFCSFLVLWCNNNGGLNGGQLF